MKKALTILAGMALGASMVSAVDIESKNVVGFNELFLATPGYTMVSVNWQNPDGTPISIQDFFRAEDLYAGEDVYDVNGDQVLVWDPTLSGGLGSYVTYYYYYEDEPENATWYDVSEIPADVTFAPGSAFWFFRSTANGESNIVVNGQVATNTSLSFTLPVGYSMVGAAFPVEEVIGTGIIGYPGEDAYDPNGDQILVWDPTLSGGLGSYVTYYYYYEDVPENAAWFDISEMPVSQTLKLGQGAWYLRNANVAGNWTQNNPL